jgi:SAM-dependent methyltransferase
VTVTVFNRKSCRLCDDPGVELVVKLAPIPLSEQYAEDRETARAVARYPVDLSMCPACGHVQQLDVVDSQSLWGGYTYFSGQAKGMAEHFEEVAAGIRAAHAPPAGSLVVDIGSNDGSLLRPFAQAGHRVLGIDPAVEIARTATAAGFETIPELMSLPLAEDIRRQRGPAHVVCAFNAFAHADNMDEVADGIRTLLAPDGLFFFEVQYLADIIDGVLIGTIFHEHMSHHSVKPMARFLDRHGLELIDVVRVPIQHGSLIGTVQLKGGARPVGPRVGQLERGRGLDRLDTLRQFAARLAELKVRTGRLAVGWKAQGLSIAGYGAARSGPTLIAQLGLDGIIDYIVDDHPQKVHRYSAGDGIQILPTAELGRRLPPYTVILAWVHAAKIIEANRAYLKAGGRFVVLCPETRIVGKDGDVRV